MYMYKIILKDKLQIILLIFKTVFQRKKMILNFRTQLKYRTYFEDFSSFFRLGCRDTGIIMKTVRSLYPETFFFTLSDF